MKKYLKKKLIRVHLDFIVTLFTNVFVLPVLVSDEEVEWWWVSWRSGKKEEQWLNGQLRGDDRFANKDN